VFCEQIDNGDTYNFAPRKNYKPLESKFVRAEVIENGALKSTFRAYYEINFKSQKTILTTDISLVYGSKRVEFVTSWENKTKDHLLQIKFNLPQNITETFAENAFGLIKRDFDPDYDLQNEIPAKKREELKTNTAPMQRFVWAEELGIITEGLTEYEVSKNSLNITILRAIDKLSKLSMNTRNFPAGPPLDTPRAQCLGKQSVKYAICITEKPQELFKEADEFFGCVVADVGNSENTALPMNLSLLKTNNNNIYTYAIKTPENLQNTGLIIRMMNLSAEIQKVSLKTDLEFSKYIEVNGLEENTAQLLNLDSELVFNPYELKNILFL
jgi:mannosylglycerate hydrolase